MKEKNEIPVGEFLHELEKMGRRHKVYFHYTTSDVMKKILGNKTLLLSPFNKMNDGKEAKMVQDNMFAACFSYGASENVAMWNTYGIPRRDAVRLSFDGRVLRQFVDGKLDVWKCQALNKDRDVIENIPSEEIKLKLTDIAYVSRKGTSFNHGDTHYVVVDEIGRSVKISGKRFAGYVKSAGWSYEREVRLLLTLKKGFVVPDMAYIAIDFSEVVKCITVDKKFKKANPILLGPWTASSEISELKKTKINVVPSDYTGCLGSLKTICDKCDDSCKSECKCKHRYAR